MTEEAPSVLYAMDGQVAVVRMNRPDRLNAVTSAMLDLLRTTIVRAQNDGARAILLTGEGRAFCSGADLTGGGRPFDERPDSGNAVRAHFNPLAQTIASSRVPVVTAVNGPAAGAGAGLALAGDIVVMARSSYVLLAFANIGLVPDCGSTWLVAKGAGRARALEMALLGERMGAEEALAAGLATRVVDDDQLLDTAMGYARRLAAMPTIALGLIRKQVATALAGSLPESLAMEAEHQSIASKTEDFAEGVAAFLQKRKPEFKGK